MQEAEPPPEEAQVDGTWGGGGGADLPAGVELGGGVACPGPSPDPTLPPPPPQRDGAGSPAPATTAEEALPPESEPWAAAVPPVSGAGGGGCWRGMWGGVGRRGTPPTHLPPRSGCPSSARTSRPSAR